MYLTANEETDVLLRTITDCAELVAEKAIDSSAAYQVIARAASHHSEHPVTKAKRKAEREAHVETAIPVPQTPEEVAI